MDERLLESEANNAFILNRVIVDAGVAIGWWRQTMATLVNFVSFYVIGIPLGVILAYIAQWEVKGMWIMLVIGIATQTIILAVAVWKTNWEEQFRTFKVERAQERTNRWFFTISEEDIINPTMRTRQKLSEDTTSPDDEAMWPTARGSQGEERGLTLMDVFKTSR